VHQQTGYASAGLLLDSQVFCKEGNAGWVSLAELPELATAHAALAAYRQQHRSDAGNQQHAEPSGCVCRVVMVVVVVGKLHWCWHTAAVRGT
jgi:hypothetical protein